MRRVPLMDHGSARFASDDDAAGDAQLIDADMLVVRPLISLAFAL